MFSESAAYEVLPGHGGSGISAGNFYSSSSTTLSNRTPGISHTSELFNTYYIYTFDGKLLAEYDHNGNCTRDYIYFGNPLLAEYQPQEDNYYYYMSDQINSTRMITDDSGNVVYSAAYCPYGEPLKTWVNTYDPDLKFSGKEREGYSGLDYFGARYYDHKSYRFNSVDPIINREEALSNPQLWNLYAYCRNNPITYLDPDGREIGPAPVDALEDYYIRKYAGPEFEEKNIKQRNQIRIYITKAILAYLIAHGLLSPDSPKEEPEEPYNRRKHYGNTPKKSDRKHFGADDDEVVDHDPPLVERYYEGDPSAKEKPGFKMSDSDRKKSANDRSRMKVQSRKESNVQGGKMSAYSKKKKKDQ
jgi:RHS repeat-associated protein